MTWRLASAFHATIHRARLPMAVVYVTERCNSRCLTCDFWKKSGGELDAAHAGELARQLRSLGTDTVLLTGGEVLFHRNWEAIARTFREHQMKLWLLTAGLALERQAKRVAELTHWVTVSLDGATPETYQRIRGVDAFDAVTAGIRALVDQKRWVSIRTTLQKSNYEQMIDLVRLARSLGVQQISFLPLDDAHPTAFARPQAEPGTHQTLTSADLPSFQRVLDAVQQELAFEIDSGFIAESREKLQQIHRYFSAVCGKRDHVAPQCNAPEFSAVVRADGRLQPCHFIEASREAPSVAQQLNSKAMTELRRQIRNGERRECTTCVCPMWRSRTERWTGLRYPEPLPAAGA